MGDLQLYAGKCEGTIIRNGDLGYFGGRGLADGVGVGETEQNPEGLLGFWPKQLDIWER